MKTKIKKIIPIVVLVVSLILNIILLTTDVFKGKYTAKSNTNKFSLRFYDNTFTLIGEEDTYNLYTYGFFEYIQQSKYKTSPTSIDLKHDAVILHRADTTSSGSSSYLRFDKKTIFCLSYQGGYLNSEYIGNFYCYSAIFLQIFYAVLIISSASYLIYHNANKRKSKNLKTN